MTRLVQVALAEDVTEAEEIQAILQAAGITSELETAVEHHPRETEDALVGHPAVADAAAFGIPHPDLGEQLIAVVQLVEPSAAGSDLAADLAAWCARRVARYKCPRRIEFIDELPRLPTGKLYKRSLRDRYWPPAP